MRSYLRGLAFFLSTWAHIGVIIALCAFVSAPPSMELRGGEGAADLGGENAAALAEATDDDLDFGEPQFHITSIGVVVDSPAAAAAPVPVAPVAVVASSAAPVAPPTPVEPKKPIEPPKTAPKASPPATAAAKVETKPTTNPVATADPAPDADEGEVVHLPRVPNGQKGRKPSGQGAKEACPVVEHDGVEKLSRREWSVERDVAEYYASHMGELRKIVSVRLAKNESGEADGFRLGLPRCSVLREGGLHTGDVVRDVNGIHVHDLFSAIGAYFKLRREDTIVLNVVRKGQSIVLRYRMV